MTATGEVSPASPFIPRCNMSRIDKWTLALAVAIAGVAFPSRLIWDLTHPENWDADPMFDPRIYLWGWAAAALIVAYVAARIVICERRKRTVKNEKHT